MQPSPSCKLASPFLPPTLNDFMLPRESINVIKDNSHPFHYLFSHLLSGRRYKSLEACTIRYTNSFLPAVIRILNFSHVKDVFPMSNLPCCDPCTLFNHPSFICTSSAAGTLYSALCFYIFFVLADISVNGMISLDSAQINVFHCILLHMMKLNPNKNTK